MQGRSSGVVAPPSMEMKWGARFHRVAHRELGAQTPRYCAAGFCTIRVVVDGARLRSYGATTRACPKARSTDHGATRVGIATHSRDAPRSIPPTAGDLAQIQYCDHVEGGTVRDGEFGRDHVGGDEWRGDHQLDELR